MTAMAFSEAGLQALTEAFEGCRLEAYPDPGTGGAPWTIGYGHTDPGVCRGMVISREQADKFLRADIAGAEAAVNRLVRVELNQQQFDALVDFAFNAGEHNLAGSHLLACVNAGDFAAADREFSRWVFGGGHKLPGLVRRRQAEAAWFSDTAWSARSTT